LDFIVIFLEYYMPLPITTHTNEKRRFKGISFETPYEAHFPLNEQKNKRCMVHAYKDV